MRVYHLQSLTNGLLADSLPTRSLYFQLPELLFETVSLNSLRAYKASFSETVRFSFAFTCLL